MSNLFRFLIFSFILILFSSCGVLERLRSSDTNSTTTSLKVKKVLQAAEENLGAPYLYAGTGEGGFDCSGLVYTAFKDAGLKIPRSSTAQAEVGEEIDRRRVRPGDLVFFATKAGETKISHVGIVTKIRKREDVLFIHAANSGVKEDNLFSNYYYNTFVKATRPY